MASRARRDVDENTIVGTWWNQCVVQGEQGEIIIYEQYEEYLSIFERFFDCSRVSLVSCESCYVLIVSHHFSFESLRAAWIFAFHVLHKAGLGWEPSGRAAEIVF